MRNLLPSLFLIGLILIAAKGQSTVEMELRAKIASMEAAQETKRVHEIAVRSGDAGAVADANAVTSQGIATENGRIAADAAKAAQQAALEAKAQLIELQRANEAGNMKLIITLGFGFLTVIAPLAFALYKDGRTRKWAVEDAEKKDKAALSNHNEVVVKLAEVKEEAHNAFEVANTVNQKLETIGVQMRDGLPLKPEVQK